MIYEGRTQVPFYYSRWGYTRGGGKTWHGGIDLVGLDSDRILMPDYKGKSISGQVVTARKVDKSTGNPTWEWGRYVCVKLDANQTPDAVNYLYFCHNEKNLVKVGDKVKSGDVLAIMGNTGNAADANPPIKHCHLEVRAASTSKGLDPTAYAGVPNTVGTYGEAPADTIDYKFVPLVSGLRVRPYPTADDDNANEAIDFLEKGKEYPLVQTRDGWAFVMTGENAGGWVCIKDDTQTYGDIK